MIRTQRLIVITLLLALPIYGRDMAAHATASATAEVIAPGSVGGTGAFRLCSVRPSLRGELRFETASCDSADGSSSSSTTGEPASFVVRSDGGASYAVTFPYDVVAFNRIDPGQRVVVRSLAGELPGGGTVSAAGVQKLAIGGTASLSADHQPGTYGAALDILVEFN